MVRWIFLVAAVAVAYAARNVITPFLIGATIAFLLNPLVNMLSRRTCLNRTLSMALVYLFVLAPIAFLIAHEAPHIIDQATRLFNQRQEILTQLAAQFSTLTGRHTDVDQIIGVFLDKLQEYFKNKPGNILAFGGVITSSLISTVLCFISSVYFLKDADKMVPFLLRFAPEGQSRQELARVLSQINCKFHKYVIGQLTLISLMAIVTYIVLAIYHVDYALVVALVTGLVEIVPVIEPAVALTAASLIAIYQLGFWSALAVPIVLVAYRFLQEYLVAPRIIGHALQLWGLSMIFAALVGDQLLGGFGMLLAIPGAAAFKVLMDHACPALAPADDDGEQHDH